MRKNTGVLTHNVRDAYVFTGKIMGGYSPPCSPVPIIGILGASTAPLPRLPPRVSAQCAYGGGRAGRASIRLRGLQKLPRGYANALWPRLRRDQGDLHFIAVEPEGDVVVVELASPDFQTFLRTCIRCTPLGADVEVIQFLGGTLRD